MVPGCRGVRVPGRICGCRGAPGQGDLAAAATEGTGRELIPPGFASKTVQPNQVGKNCLNSAFDRKILFFFSSDSFLRQIWNNPERMIWVQFMLKVGSHLSGDSVSFLSVGTAATLSNKSFRWKYSAWT